MSCGRKAAKVPVEGSYNSLPATRTLPVLSRIALCQAFAVFMSPVAVKVPVEGSYNSALDTGWGENPPAIRTLPLGSKAAAVGKLGAPVSPPPLRGLFA